MCKGRSKLSKFDELVKSQKAPHIVIPVKTGIQENQPLMDSRFRGSDDLRDFLRDHQVLFERKISQFLTNWLFPEWSLQIDAPFQSHIPYLTKKLQTNIFITMVYQIHIKSVKNLLVGGTNIENFSLWVNLKDETIPYLPL